MINKCLFPAAGFGTRFLPVTKTVPKEMLPVLNKPLLQYGVEEALSADINNMAIVTGRGKRAISDYFDETFELNNQLNNTNKLHYLDEIRAVIDSATFTYIRQKSMKGLGDAVLTGEPLIGNESFAVILADDLCVNQQGDSVLRQMLTVYKKYQCSIIAIEEVPFGRVSSYGVISGHLIDNTSNIYRVDNMIEKPNENEAPSNLAIIGRYILTPDIFNILRTTKADKNGEVQITNALKKQAEQGKVIAYQFNGKRFDCGSVPGYLKANNYFAKQQNIEL